MTRTRFAPIALLGLVAVAQVPPAPRARKPVFVRVVDDAGVPRAGVEVTLAGGMAQLVAEACPVDVQTITTDARGRATARVEPDLCYAAWVYQAQPGREVALVGGPVGYFAANAMVDLVCREEQLVFVRVTGTEAWQELGPLRFFLVTPHPGTATELFPKADGYLRMTPSLEGDLEVRTARGEPLWSQALAGIGSGDLKLPPPQAVRVVVTDAGGQPIAGARIRHRVDRRGAWRFDPGGGVDEPIYRTVGTTDAAGRATVCVPYETEPLHDPGKGVLMLFADAPGMPAVAGGVYGKAIYVDDRRNDEFHQDELPFHLAPAEPIVVPAGIVPPGATAQLFAVCKLRMRANSYAHDARPFVARAGADGRLVFEGVPEDLHSLRIAIVLQDDGGTRSLCTFAADSGRRLPTELTGPKAALRTSTGSVDVTLLDGGGGPARGAVLCAIPTSGTSSYQRESMVRLPIDGAGHARARLGFGSWILVGTTAVGVVSSEVELQPDRGDQQVEMRLEALGRMRVRVVDADGKPVRGARLRLASTRVTASGAALRTALNFFTQQLRARWETLRTDADGRMDLPVVPLDQMRFEFQLVWDDHATDKFAVEANDEPLVLRPK